MEDDISYFNTLPRRCLLLDRSLCMVQMNDSQFSLTTGAICSHHYNMCFVHFRLFSWLLACLLYCCCTWVKPAAAFVNLMQPRATIAATGSSRSGGSNKACGACEGGARRVDRGVWSNAEARRRKQSGGCSRRGDSLGGVRSLNSALGMPPMAASDIVEFFGRELQEQSVRHHWQSGFIGGSVGCVGTLTAIQVRGSVHVVVCLSELLCDVLLL